ncbi:hypothetical protein NJF54_25250, partial [Pseudomonas guariconensis]|nr:hypothetical protein [Pseudomonas guariconensis]MCO7635127.1 hypothetical protein [Pseudomonas guariconensis]
VSLGHGRMLRLKGENSTENQAFSGSGGVSKVFIQSLANPFERLAPKVQWPADMDLESRTAPSEGDHQ